MPISSDRFEEIDEKQGEPTAGTNAARVLEFLRAHPDQAFTQSEIAAETGVKTGSIGPTLVRLRERGRVDHRGNYWRVSDHDRGVDAAARHSAATVSARESEDKTPRMESWDEHAVDPRAHRNE